MKAQSEWQLIATAPRDGRPVLLFHPDWDTVDVGMFNPDIARWQERRQYPEFRVCGSGG